MSYSNITVVTSQGTYGYSVGATTFNPILYNTLDLIPGIPHNAQLEVERIFSTDRNGVTATIPNFLNDTNVSVVDKQKVFIIPSDRITYDTTGNRIVNINLPASGADVYNFSYIPISGPNAGVAQTIAVPQLREGDNIIVRRKTVSNVSLVQWTPGSKLTTAQLNLNTTQMLFLVQEILNKVTIVSISTEQILDNAITSSKILNKAVTFSKLQDLSGPLKLLGSGSDPINFNDVREMSVGPGFDVIGNTIDVKPIANGQRNDINVVAANTDWRINPNAVTYSKIQTVATANRVLGSTTAGGTVSEVQVNTNMLVDNAVTLAKLQTLPENTLIGRGTGFGNAESIALSSAGRELINDISIADMRQTLQLGTAALSASTDFALASHTHGNISNTGNIGSTANLPIITGTSGILQVGSFGTSANTFCQGNDNRLSDARTPLPHEHSMSDITSGTLGVSRGGTGVTTTPTNGQLLIGNGTGFSLATLTAGTNVTITNNQGAITITSATEPVAPSAVLADGTYGDISISGNTWTVVNNAILTSKIANDQVTFAKLQNISTNKLLGRSSVGSGDVEEINLTAAGRDLLDDVDVSAQRNTLGLGTSSVLNVALTGDAAASEVVKGNDTRLTNTRTPTDNSVTTIKIVDENITEAKIATGAITNNKIANNAVTFGKLPVIVSANRLLGATTAGATISEVQVNTDMVLENAITTSKIADANITSNKLASGAAVVNIGTGGVTGNLLATDSVTTVKIADLNITSDKLANNSVTDAKLRTGAATSVIGRSANTVGNVADIVASTDGQVLHRTGGTLQFGTLGSGSISDGAITTAKIADIAANRVLGTVSGAVSAVQVQTGMIADGAVTGIKLADSSVTTAKINNGSITADKLNGNQTGSAPIYGARAIAKYTIASDQGALTARKTNNLTFTRQSGQIRGAYIGSFATAMPDADYVVNVTTGGLIGGSQISMDVKVDSQTTTSFRVRVYQDGGGGLSDVTHFSVAVFG